MLYFISEFDTSKTGYLEESVIKKKLSSLGEDQLTLDEINSMLVLIKDKKDDKVNYRGKFSHAQYLINRLIY